MLILLPPSEGKTRPAAGPALDLATLSFPELTKTRELLVRTLIRVSAGNPRTAASTLGLGPTQTDALDVNARLLGEPTARADEVFTGVLFEAASLPTLSRTARERADETVAIANALFGLVRPSDPIPAFRLSGDVTLPRLGTVKSRWKPLLPRAIEKAADGLVIDLRSGTYAAFGAPPAGRTATLRVLQDRGGTRSVVSHFNKATKGRIVRALLESGDSPGSVPELHTCLSDLGWTVERDGSRLDVVVTEV